MPSPPPLPESPAWLKRLAERYDTWRWLDEAERAAIAEEMSARYAHRGPAFVPLQPEIVHLCQRLLERLVAIASVEIAPRRPDVVAHRATLFVEIAAPQHLIVCVHHELPPLLWFPAGSTAEELRGALKVYSRADAAPRSVDFMAHRSGFIGTPGILEMSRDDLLSHWSTSPLAESLFWGSAHIEDPWPGLITAAELPELAAGAEAFLAQAPEEAWSVSFRAIASRSIVTFEDHDGLYAIKLAYDPAPHGELIEALNAQFAQRWPLDMPVDLCALLIGLRFESAEHLRALIALSSSQEEEIDELIFNLYALSSCLSGSLDAVPTLKPFMRHAQPAVREAVADIALRHRLDFMLLWFLELEPDASPLHEAIASRLL